MEKLNGSIQNERRLWHGTAAEAVHNINAEGLTRALCGKNGEAPGGTTTPFCVSLEALSGSQNVWGPVRTYPGKTDKKYLHKSNSFFGSPWKL